MNKWVLLSIGGVAGTIARYLLGAWIPGLGGSGFPFGTLLINLSACFLIGVFNSMGQTRALLSPDARLLLMTGFCGAYSTFSTWILESSALLADGELLRASANVFGSVVLGFALFEAGMLLGSIL